MLERLPTDTQTEDLSADVSTPLSRSERRRNARRMRRRVSRPLAAGLASLVVAGTSLAVINYARGQDPADVSLAQARPESQDRRPTANSTSTSAKDGAVSDSSGSTGATTTGSAQPSGNTPGSRPGETISATSTTAPAPGASQGTAPGSATSSPGRPEAPADPTAAEAPTPGSAPARNNPGAATKAPSGSSSASNAPSNAPSSSSSSPAPNSTAAAAGRLAAAAQGDSAATRYQAITSGRDNYFSYGGGSWGIHTDNGSRSNVVTSAERISNPDGVRMTLGAGDTPVNMGAVQRVELEGHNSLQYGQNYRWNTQVRLSGAMPGSRPMAGGGYESDWMVIMQVHQMSDPQDYSGVPPFAVNVRPGGQLEVITSNDPNSVTTSTSPRRVTRAVFPSGGSDWHDISITFRFTRGGGDGYLKVAWDGAVKFEGTIPMGYNDTRPPYPKQGIYRSQMPGVTEVDFRGGAITAG